MLTGSEYVCRYFEELFSSHHNFHPFCEAAQAILPYAFHLRPPLEA